MQRLLSQHPEAVCAESRAFGDYYDPNPLSTPHLTLEKYLGILSNYYAPSVNGLKPADSSFYRVALFNFVDTLAATTMATLNKPLYGEKFTPYTTTAEHAVEVWHEYNPALKFVNLTRDGRDVIVSGGAQWLNHRLRRASAGEKAVFQNALRNHTIMPEDFDRFLGYWTEAVTAGLKARDRFPCYLSLSYEKFLAHPVAQATVLFEFLGINASPAVVRTCVEAAAFDKLSGGRKSGEEDGNSFFRKGEAGDWKNWFSPDQERMFEQRAGTLLRTLGYA
ncbi:MAG: sulfotransferase [Pedosphaera sp.]|nr:sulfotransferase [Pedosphaera sp.]